jgi:hypothetical protein
MIHLQYRIGKIFAQELLDLSQVVTPEKLAHQLPHFVSHKVRCFLFEKRLDRLLVRKEQADTVEGYAFDKMVEKAIVASGPCFILHLSLISTGFSREISSPVQSRRVRYCLEHQGKYASTRAWVQP